jgi:glycosyltransferase involved in cell wall biosynthesis
MAERVIYIVRSWPRLSQTFIVNEILALERRGVELAVFSLVRSRETVVQPQVEDVRAPVHFLEDDVRKSWLRRSRVQLAALLADPGRYTSTLVHCLLRPRLAAGYGEASSFQCFFHAVRVARAIEDMHGFGHDPVRVHAHFAHDPALVGMLVARLTGIPFSFTAHARDLFQIPAASLVARARAATAVVTCCAASADYVRATVPGEDRPPVVVIHHGVELDRFAPAALTAAGVASGPARPEAAGTPRLVSVGRLVEKKGYVDLLAALREVHRAGLACRCEIYGDGPLGAALGELRDRLGLQQQVHLMGARRSDKVLSALRAADAFVLFPRNLADGDRDGIPNVLVEAMACGLPVATTTAGGVSELVTHDVNGLVCPPGDVAAISAAITRLVTEPDLRSRLGRAGRATVEADYDVDVAARRMQDEVLRTRAAAASGAGR